MNVLRRPHLVEEVLNDTMMVVWEKIDGFHGAGRLSTWIFGIGTVKLTSIRLISRPDELEFQCADDGKSRTPADRFRNKPALGMAAKLLQPNRKSTAHYV